MVAVEADEGVEVDGAAGLELRDLGVPDPGRGPAGKVLLAHAPDELLQKVLDRGLPRYTPHTIVMPGPLSRALAEIRRTGVSYSHEELTLGTVSVASPVRDADDAVVAALSIVVRTRRVDLAHLGPAVRTAAISISRQNRERSLRLSTDDPGGRQSR